MSDDGAPPRRRDFLSLVAMSGAAVAGGAALWPLIASLEPAADVRALAPPTIDLSTIGYQRSTFSLPVLRFPLTVFRLTADQQIRLTHGVDVQRPLARRDALGRHMVLADGAVPWHAPIRPDIMVFIPVCTWDAIRVKDAQVDMRAPMADGYQCPWCGSAYDFAGRVVSGPAVLDFGMPRYSFRGSNTLVISVNATGV